MNKKLTLFLSALGLWILLFSLLFLYVYANEDENLQDVPKISQKEDLPEGEKYGLSSDKKQFLVCLAGNATTGYEWNYFISDEDVLLCSDSSYTPDSDLIGAPGHAKFVFSPVRGKSGDVTVRLSYSRPWENRIPLYTYTFVLHVQTDGTMTILSVKEP